MESTSDRPAECRVCAGGALFALRARERQLGRGEEFDYLECRDCGCLQIATLPEHPERYYPERYYAHRPVDEPRRMRRPSRWLGAWARRRIASPVPPAPFAHRHAHRLEWFRRTGTRQSDPILDVGCGDGRLLWWLHRAGFDDLTGIDASLRSASPGRDASPRFERRALEEHEGRYRLVMAHHSFEHMRDPRRAFAAFGRLVSEEGWLVLRVPNAEGWARRHYGADWVQLDAPRHLHLHTRRSIEALAGREGFRVVGIVDDSGPFQIWGSELYRRGISLEGGGRGGRRALSLRERVSARRRAAALRAQGLGDQACFYLQRSDRLSSGAEGSTRELRALPAS